MARGTRGDATWHPRPHGRATRAHVGSLGGLSGCERVAGATRVHANAPGEGGGRHMASEGAGMWRAHGLVGLGDSIGAVTHLRYAAPPFILTFLFFSSVRDYVPGRSSFVGDVAAPWTSDEIAINKGASIAWTRVHAIIIMTRAQNGNKWNLTAKIKSNWISSWRRVDASWWSNRRSDNLDLRGSWTLRRGIVSTIGAWHGRIETLRSRLNGWFTQNRGIVIHDHQAIMAVDQSSLNQTVRNFRRIFFYKIVLSPFVS